MGFGTDRVFDVGVGLAISGLQVASDFTVYDLLPVYETKSSPVFATPPAAVFELSSLLAANGGDGSEGFVINGVTGKDTIGGGVSFAGDINGDGLDDYLIATLETTADGSLNGESYVVLGDVSSSITNINLSSLDGNNGFVISNVKGLYLQNRSGSSAGDLNGDGFDDIIVGAAGADLSNTAGYSGEAYVIFGSDSAFPAIFDPTILNGANGFIVRGLDEGDRMGISVSSAGDLNGDGFDDVIIGASGGDANGSFAGESYVIFGKATGFDSFFDLSNLNGSNGFVLNGIDELDQSGQSVASAGDVNGDGFSDLLIGASSADPNGNNSGESYVVFGSSAGFAASFELSALNGTNGFTIRGVDAFDNSGGSVSSAGDFNGDGFDDIIIGAVNADPNGNYSAGESYIVFGNSAFGASVDLSNLNGTNGFVLSGTGSYDSSGRSVSSAGDINGDGFDDIIIGANQADISDFRGKSYVVFGTSANLGSNLDLSGLNGQNGFVINGVNGGDYSGTSVSSAGDINGDGFDDLIIGAPLGPYITGPDGESYIIYGRADFGRTTEMLTPGDDVYVASAERELVYGLAGNDTITGASGGDFLFGDAGDDVLSGADGNDVLDGGAGADALDGGAGIDTVSYELSTAGVSIFLSSGNSSGGDAAGDSLSNIENAIGSANDDTLTGSTDDNHLIGKAGNDTLRGAGGDDVIEGGDGEDTILGNAGEDDLSGGAGNDLIIGGGDDDLIDGGLGDDQLSGQGGDDTIIGNAGIDDILGGAGADTIWAGTGDDIVNAGGGNDTVNGDDGADNLSAGAGSDTVYGGAGDDMVFGNNQNDMLFGDDGGDILDGGAGNDLLDGGDGDDALFGAGSQDTLLGGLGIDLLFGGSGGDNLDGGDGNDTLEGGGGNDTLTGGAGADTFSQTSGFRSDRITDFENGIDLIDFSNNISANSFADVMAAASQSGANVRIELNPNNILILENFDLADLDASDFIF